MEHNSELELIIDQLRTSILFEPWDAYTKSVVHTLLSLRNIPYLAPDKIDHSGRFDLSLKIDGNVYMIKIDSAGINAVS